MSAGPPSDAQLAELLEQQKKRRTRAILIFLSVGVLLAIVLGGSSLYFGSQAKKKRNLAYSRVTKCMFGEPLKEGEAPMQKFRAAWRGRILDPGVEAPPEPGTRHRGPAALRALDVSEEQKAKMWPNRCVPEIVAFTDTLKELGEMKEGEKDLGYYSRNLSKETAGDNWQQIETYQTALEDFFNEAAKAKFQYVDVPEIQGPKYADAKGVEDLTKGGVLDVPSVDIDREGNAYTGTIRFYAPAGKGKNEQLCTAKGDKQLTCARPIPNLPAEASGIPWILGGDDDAQPLLAFGRRGGIADGSSISTGVWRAGDGLRIVPADEFYVAGGWSNADGSANVLVKDQKDPMSDKFKIAHVSAGSDKVEMNDVQLEGWNGVPASIMVLGTTLVYAGSDEIRHIEIGSKDKPTGIKLPGTARRIRGCRVGNDLIATATTSADGLARLAVTYADKPFGATGVAMIDDGAATCGKQSLSVLTAEALSVCANGSCENKTLAEDAFASKRAYVDGSLVLIETMSGLLQIRWIKDGKEIANVIYDGQMKGRDILTKSRLGGTRLLVGRDFALLSIPIDEKLYFVQLDGAGNVSPVQVTTK